MNKDEFLETRLSEAGASLADARETAIRYRELFEQTSDAVIVHRPDGRLVEANLRAVELYRYATKEELLAAGFSSIHAGEPPWTDAAARRELDLAAEGAPRTFEWLARRKDGSTFPAEVTLRGADVRGDRLVLAGVRDITTRKREEERIRAALREKEALLKLQTEAQSKASWSRIPWEEML